MLLATCNLQDNIARCRLCDWRSNSHNKRPAEYQVLEHLRLIHHRYMMLDIDERKGVKYYHGPYWHNDAAR